MNYTNHYNTLIERAKTRILEGYSESHHIVPKCRGGTDDETNLVRLTPEEHFLAHQLLIKIFPDDEKLIFAAWMMCSNNQFQQRTNNKRFGWLRRAFNIAQKTQVRKKRAIETKPRKKRTLSKDHRDKLSKAGTGKTRTAEQKLKISLSQKGRKFSEQTRQKMSDSAKGKKLSDDTRAKLSQLNKGIPKPQQEVTCPHCGKSGGKSNMTRYHFDKCQTRLP